MNETSVNMEVAKFCSVRLAETRMGQLSIALTRALDQLELSQSAFAERAGLTRVQVNRAARGTSAVGPDVIEKIVRALPPPHNSMALVGWLEDEVPGGLEGLVVVQPGEGALDAPPPKPRAELDPRRENLLRWVEKEIVGVEFCDMLESLRTAIQAR